MRKERGAHREDNSVQRNVQERTIATKHRKRQQRQGARPQQGVLTLASASEAVTAATEVPAGTVSGI